MSRAQGGLLKLALAFGLAAAWRYGLLTAAINATKTAFSTPPAKRPITIPGSGTALAGAASRLV